MQIWMPAVDWDVELWYQAHPLFPKSQVTKADCHSEAVPVNRLVASSEVVKEVVERGFENPRRV